MGGRIQFSCFPSILNVLPPQTSGWALIMCSGHSEPSVYSGPTVKVLSSTITSSQFTAQLQLSNSTTWVNSGSLDIGSSDASVIWAYGSSAPSNPSNPNSDFQEHDGKGTFSINMVSAQVVQQGPSPTSPAATGVPTGNDTTTNGTTTESTPTGSFPAAPVITGVSHAGTVIGLSYRDKVPSSFHWKHC